MYPNKKPAQWLATRELENGVTVGVSLETGVLGFKGLGPAPIVCLYKDQVEQFLGMADAIRQYIADHPETKTSEERNQANLKRSEVKKAARILSQVDPSILAAFLEATKKQA